MEVASAHRLRVLVLDEEVPWPLNNGKRIRTWNLLRRLSMRHDLHLVAYGPATEEAKSLLAQHGFTVTVVDPLPASEGLPFWSRLAASTLSPYPYSVIKHYTTRLQQQVTKICESQHIDLVHIEWIPYARYKSPGVPRLIVAHNVESDIWRRRAKHDGGLMGSWFFGLQAKRMEAFERAAATDGSHVVVVSELDAKAFRSYGARNVTVVANGVDLDYFRPCHEGSPGNSLLFVGALDWYPNEDGVREFAAHILPLVRRRNQSVTLRVVGRKPSARLIAALWQLDGVEIVGEVPDVRPYMEQARAVVVPLRIGGGTRIKILEALAMGKPVVSTSIGAEGLDIQNQRDYVQANTPEEFAERIDVLLASPEEQRRLGRNGRAVVERLYSWDASAANLERGWYAAAHQAQKVACS